MTEYWIVVVERDGLDPMVLLFGDSDAANTFVRDFNRAAAPLPAFDYYARTPKLRTTPTSAFVELNEQRRGMGLKPWHPPIPSRDRDITLTITCEGREGGMVHGG